MTSGTSVGGDPAVVTPDAVGLDLPVATVGSRGIAWLLDAIALLVGFLLIAIATALFGGGGFVPDWFGIALLLVLLFVWQFGYPILFELTLRGRTPGKAAMGLRVVTIEGAPIGVRHAIIRALLAVFELLGTLGAPAVVTSLVSKRGQRLGDLAAGTMVVRERRVGGPPQAAVFAPPPGLEAYTAQLDTTSIGPATYATIRDTLRRAPSLPDGTRLRITSRLADAVAPRVTPPPPAGVPAEPWLWCVAAAVQARRAPVATRGGQERPVSGWVTDPPPPAGPPIGPPPAPASTASSSSPPPPAPLTGRPAGGPDAPAPNERATDPPDDGRDRGFAPPT